MPSLQLQSPAINTPADILGHDFVDFTSRHDPNDAFSGIAANIVLHELRIDLENLPPHAKAGVIADLTRSAPEGMKEALLGAKNFKHIRDGQLGEILGHHVAAMAGYQERLEAIKPQVDQDFARRVMQASEEGLLHWTAAYGLSNIHNTDVAVLDCYASSKSAGESRLYGYAEPARRLVASSPTYQQRISFILGIMKTCMYSLHLRGGYP